MPIKRDSNRLTGTLSSLLEGRVAPGEILTPDTNIYSSNKNSKLSFSDLPVTLDWSIIINPIRVIKKIKRFI